ncbi:MAG: hypothetical protein IH598_10975 [Bacteroidales bacterium]|nr:hypothetical protein [Bacteroidales bacterium]
MSALQQFLRLKKVPVLFGVLLAATVVYMSSCSKLQDNFDFDKLVIPDWNPEYAIPLANSSYAVNDFFSEASQEFIHVDEAGLISLVYTSDQLFSSPAEEFFFLENRYFDHEFALYLLSSGDTDTLSGQFSYSFYSTANKKRIDSVFFKAGTYSFKGKTNLNKDNAQLTLSIPELIHVQSGETLKLEFSLDNPGGQQEWVDFEVVTNLDGYKLIINPETSGGTNKINVFSELIVESDQNPNLSPYDMEISGDMLNMKYSDFYGYMGMDSFKFIDTINIDIFNSSIGGSVEVGPDALMFVVETHNAIGVPIRFKAETLQAYSPYTSPFYADVFLFGEGTENEFDILSPTPAQIGQSVYTKIDFGQTNFPEVFLNLAPREFYYDFDAILNADDDSTAQNVLQDTSRISFATALEFKLFTAIDLLTLQDTLDFRMEGTTIDEIDYLLVRINTENGFPLNAGIQLYFADAEFQIIDSLIYDADKRIIAGGEVGLPPQLKVIKSTKKTTDIRIEKPRLEKILEAKKMLLNASLSTTNGELAKIYDDYSLTLKVGAITGLNIKN